DLRLVLWPAERVAVPAATLAGGLHVNMGGSAGITAGGFEIAAEPDTAQPLALACFVAAPLEAFPITELHRALHHCAICAIVVGDALRILVGKGRGRNKIAPSKRDAVEAVLKGRFVDQPLDDVNDFWPAGAAIRNCRDRVREHRTRAHMR